MSRGLAAIVVLLLFAGQAVAQNEGGLSTVALALIIVGSIAATVIILVAIACIISYKRKHLGHLELQHPNFERDREQPYLQTPGTVQLHYDAHGSDGSNDAPDVSNDVQDHDSTHVQQPIVESDGDAASVDADDPLPLASSKSERRERFEERLLELQPHTDTLQEMLLDVQDRVKTIKHGNPRLHGYKAVSRDLNRVQHLLSKRNSTALKVPPDGTELLSWADNMRQKYLELQKYKLSKESGASSDRPEMSSIMWIQSKDDSAFDDEPYDESAII